jgi:hypothetical protein
LPLWNSSNSFSSTHLSTIAAESQHQVELC